MKVLPDLAAALHLDCSTLVLIAVLALTIGVAFGQLFSKSSHYDRSTPAAFSPKETSRRSSLVPLPSLSNSSEQRLRCQIRDLEAQTRTLQQCVKEETARAKAADATVQMTKDKLRQQAEQHLEKFHATTARHVDEMSHVKAHHRQELERRVGVALADSRRMQTNAESMRQNLHHEKGITMELRMAMKKERLRLQEIASKTELDVADIRNEHNMLKDELEKIYRAKTALVTKQLKDCEASHDEDVARLKQDHQLQVSAKEAEILVLREDLREAHRRNKMLVLYDQVTADKLNKMIADGDLGAESADELTPDDQYQAQVRSTIHEAEFGPAVLMTRDHVLKTILSRVKLFDEVQARRANSTQPIEDMQANPASRHTSVVSSSTPDEQLEDLQLKCETVVSLQDTKPEVQDAVTLSSEEVEESIIAAGSSTLMSQEESQQATQESKVPTTEGEQRDQPQEGLLHVRHAPGRSELASEADQIDLQAPQTMTETRLVLESVDNEEDADEEVVATVLSDGAPKALSVNSLGNQLKPNGGGRAGIKKLDKKLQPGGKEPKRAMGGLRRP